jgi:hypothetical protein
MSSGPGGPYSLVDPLVGRRPARVELHELLGGKIEDISPYVSKVTVNSSLDSPFMGVTVTMSDNDEIIDRIKVDGDKAVVFRAYAGNDDTITGKFHINSISFIPQNNRKTNAVQLNCIAMEHIHNASQKVQEWKFWYTPTRISAIINFIAQNYLAISPTMRGQTSGSQNINLPKLHPMEAITMLCQRAHGQGKNIYSFYHKFDSGKPKYFFDEVSTLMSYGKKWDLVLTENNVGQVEHEIDSQYLAGSPISKITTFNSNSFYDSHQMIKQGYPGRTYIQMDFVNKVYKSEDDEEQHVVIGERQMPQVVGIAKNNKDLYLNRAIYDPFNGDSTYFRDPKLEENFKTSRPVVSGLLNKRISVMTYGCPSIGPGDTVEIQAPGSTASGDQRKGTVNQDLSKKYLVYAVGHSFGVAPSKTFVTELQLASDGQR